MPPQVDLETSVTDYDPAAIVEVYEPGTNPPESFYLSKDAEYEWFDRNAFFERKESTKGNTIRSNSSSSQRFSVSLKSKASIIGLPKKATFVVDSKRRSCKPAAHMMSLFPKRSGSSGKTLVEPGSPKVSCMGRVRSKRCRRRSNSLKRKDNKSVVERSESRNGKEKKATGGGGLYSKVMSMFRSKKGGKNKPQLRSGSGKVDVEPETEKNANVAIVIGDEPVAVEPPRLGGMNRFASGRRPGSWAGQDFR